MVLLTNAAIAAGVLTGCGGSEDQAKSAGESEAFAGEAPGEEMEPPGSECSELGGSDQEGFGPGERPEPGEEPPGEPPSGDFPMDGEPPERDSPSRPDNRGGIKDDDN